MSVVVAYADMRIRTLRSNTKMKKVRKTVAKPAYMYYVSGPKSGQKSRSTVLQIFYMNSFSMKQT